LVIGLEKWPEDCPKVLQKFDDVNQLIESKEKANDLFKREVMELINQNKNEIDELKGLVLRKQTRIDQLENKIGGRFQCKLSYGGENCDECAPEHYGYPNCKNCSCNSEGSVDLTCDNSGTCSCKSNRFVGAKCDTCASGYSGSPLCNQCAPGYFGYPNCETCPTSDPYYALVIDQCLYFEKIEMNYTDAKVNCANKMARYGKGRLYEPKSLDSSETVAAKFFELSLIDYFYIGVNDIVQPDTHVYDSNSMPLSFTPKWYSDPDSDSDYRPVNQRGAKNTCIIVGSSTSFLGKWIDYWCFDLFYSVCE